MFRPFIIPVFLPHSGCPHRCIFCNQTAITGYTEKFPGRHDLLKTISRFLQHKGKNRGKTEISFYGGNFLGLSWQQIQLCLDAATSFVEKNKVDGIRFSTRPETICPQILRRIAAYPITTIEIGVQSMIDSVLELSNRGHSAADARQAMALLKKTEYQTGIQMMVGLPGDTRHGSLFTAMEIAALAPDFVRIYPTLVIKGSPLAQWYQTGRYHPLTLEDCVSRVKRLYQIFTAFHITVIRMGLQATEGLSSESVLAGPYHPALGHMVLSEIMKDLAVKKISYLAPDVSEVVLRVHPKNYSRMQGLNRKNISELKETFRLSRIHLLADDAIPVSDVAVALL